MAKKPRVTSVIEYPNDLLEMLKPGKAVNVCYPGDNPNNEKRHIRAIVDDEWIVYMVYRRNRWTYHIDWIYAFLRIYEDGYLK